MTYQDVKLADYSHQVYNNIFMRDLTPIKFGQKLENIEFFIQDILTAMDMINVDNPHRLDNDTVLNLIDKHFSLHLLFLINNLDKNKGMEKYFTRVWWNGASDYQRVKEVHKQVRIRLLTAIKNGLSRVLEENS